VNDKIIEVTPETERRLSQRRASDRNLETRVSKLEGLASDYRLSVTRSEQQRERRRFQLLQASAMLRTAVDNDDATPLWTREEAVIEAEMLLAEIERREQEHQRKESNHAPTGDRTTHE
jgi:hypothetical protein